MYTFVYIYSICRITKNKLLWLPIRIDKLLINMNVVKYSNISEPIEKI